MSDLLERLYRRAAAKGRFDADQELLMRAADEIRRLRTDIIAMRARDIARMATQERNNAPQALRSLQGVDAETTTNRAGRP